MHKINTTALVIAIQAVDDKIGQLIAQLDNDKADGRLELVLLDHENAAESLRLSYLEALKKISNLP
ncbi:MAG: hypothetical protein HOP21_12825, partial [Methylotenera sp.]|nr:hypothetical protein [Methylotenera sp.]